jgi:hypothetical protein
MQQLTLNVREENMPFLSELLDNFDFVEIVKSEILIAKKSEKPTKILKNGALDAKKKQWTKAQLDFYDAVKEGLEEVELHRQGKIKLPTFEEMLNEL